MKKTIKNTAALLMLIATLGSCQKGDTGAPGATGPAGANGANGTNANVHTGMITLSAANWTWDTAPVYGSYCGINYPAITQNVLDSGVVTVFFSDGNGGWTAAPYTGYSNPATSYSLSYTYHLSGIVLWLYYSDFSNDTDPFTNATFKFVTVDASLRRANPNTNWKNYNEVQAALNKRTEASQIQ